MIKLYLSILLLLWPTTLSTTQAQSLVNVSIIRQQTFRNTGHHPENNRRVTFRAVNLSNQALIVYGFSYEGGFDPTGYIISFDDNSGEWIYPTNDNRPISWSELSRESKDSRILRPGKSLTFTAEMSQLEVGGRFRRTVYVASKVGAEPKEISSKEFVLR